MDKDIKEIRDLISEFYNLTGINLYRYLDPLIIKLNGFGIDIIAFDDYLHSKFGDYEKMVGSMKDLLKLRYGDRASEIFETLIKI